MRSPKQRLADAIEVWRRREAHEQIARWRTDPDALPAGARTEEQRKLTGPRVREFFETCVDRGLLPSDELSAMASALRDAALSPARELADQLVRSALAAPIPHDSNHHRGAELLRRISVFDAPTKRRAMARSLVPTFESVNRARREGRDRLAEAHEEAAWLDSFDIEPLDPAPADLDGLAVLESTDEAWREVLERLSHAARSPAEHWSDLLPILRQHKWDDCVSSRTRPRRLAEGLRSLGLDEVLRRRARLEPSGPGLHARLLVVRVREDVRVRPGRELGVASERDVAASLGHAAALLLAHPGLPTHVARPSQGSVARTIGALFAHLHSDPIFMDDALAALSSRERRAVRELALGIELFELRTAAAGLVCAAHVGQNDFPDAAHAQLERAWTVELPSALAAAICDDPNASMRLRATRLAPALAVTLREHFDEDFWRNPRSSEPILIAASRGAGLSAETWAEELGVDPETLGARMTELLS